MDQIIGATVRQLRVATGLTQDALAARMTRGSRNWHQTTVGKVEAGTRPVSLTEAIDLAAALGVDVPDLYRPVDGEYARVLVEYRATREDIDRLGREFREQTAATARLNSDMAAARVRMLSVIERLEAVRAVVSDPAEAQKLDEALDAAAGDRAEVLAESEIGEDGHGEHQPAT